MISANGLLELKSEDVSQSDVDSIRMQFNASIVKIPNDYANFEGFCEESKKYLEAGNYRAFRAINRFGKQNETIYSEDEFNVISEAYREYLTKSQE